MLRRLVHAHILLGTRADKLRTVRSTKTKQRLQNNLKKKINSPMIQRKHISLGLHFSGNIHVNNRPSTDLNKVLQRNGRVKVKEDEFIPSSENMKKKEISIKIASLG